MINFHQVPVGETLQGPIELRYIDIQGSNLWPVVCLVAGLHGNETSSVLGLLSFIRSLRDEMRNKGTGKEMTTIQGRIVAFPAVNTLGLLHNERGIRDAVYTHEDTNRGFPGNPLGSLRDRLVARLFSEVIKVRPDVVVDLHTGNARSLPYSIIDWVPDENLRKRSIEYAQKFGFASCLDLPQEHYSGKSLDTSLSAQVMAAGIPAFTVEVPGGRFAQREAISWVHVGISQVVSTGGLRIIDRGETIGAQIVALQRERLARAYRCINVKLVYQRALGPRASHGGFFRELTNPGDHVRKGETIGEIIDWRGDVLEVIRANVTGVISDIVDATTVMAGDQLFELLIEPNGA